MEDADAKVTKSMKELVHGKTEEEAENILIKTFGSVPEEWFDPLRRAELLDQNPSATLIEGHLTNFENSYGGESRLGKSAKGIGDLRNVAGQGMPGEEQWRSQIKVGKTKVK